MSDAATIHIAYAISRKAGTSYRARAYVLDRGAKHSFVVGIGDDANEAMAEAVKHIENMHKRDGVTVPQHIKYHGSMPGAIADAYAF